MSKHGAFEGIHLPIAGAAVWKLKNGGFSYIELASLWKQKLL